MSETQIIHDLDSNPDKAGIIVDMEKLASAVLLQEDRNEIARNTEFDEGENIESNAFGESSNPYGEQTLQREKDDFLHGTRS